MKSTKQKNKAPINFLIAFLTLCMLALIVFSVYSIFFRKGNSKSKEQISDSISNSSLQEETIQTVPRPDNPNENEAYYWDNAEVLEVINANDSKSVLTESQAIELLKDRGFEDCNVIYNYSMDGQYSDESDADENADTKHPMYKAYYSSQNSGVWTIFIIDGMIMANPASYNLESEKSAQLLISETNKLTSYESEDNKFYVTIPKESAIILKTVDKIDSQTLDKLTTEEIDKL